MLWKIGNFQSLMGCQCPQYSKRKSISMSSWTSENHHDFCQPLIIWEGALAPWDDWADPFSMAGTAWGTDVCSWNKSHGLQEDIQPFCEAWNLLEEFAKMLGWIWERNMFPVVLIDSAGLAVFSSCTSGPVVLASCLAVAQLALSIFVTDQAVPWQISHPFPLFVNHLI